MSDSPESMLELMRTVRQVRQYYPDPIADETLDALLEIARWTGSSRNTQPWHFIVVTDKNLLKQLSEVRSTINWVADAPLAIALVFNGESAITEAYDEGRVSERIMIAARLLGLGAGTAWYGDENQQTAAKKLLGVPDNLAAHSLVALGRAVTIRDPRPNRVTGGRKPRSEVVSYNRYGAHDPA